MKYITGKQDLNDMFEESHIAQMKKRFSFPFLMKYLRNISENKVCTLYGLRRTGKTTLMVQAAKALDAPEKVCWLFCEKGDTMGSVRKVMDENPQCKYFFLDEATRLSNFMDNSSILSDYYAAVKGKKIVMAGTDSLGFRFTFDDQLYDRTYVIHTTYISFQEYRYLLGEDKTIDDYIEYGGTLTDGSVFYNGESGTSYTNDAIAENIQRTLEKYQDGGKFDNLLSLYKKKILTTCINKLVEINNRSFLKDTLEQKFKSHDMGKLQSVLDGDASVTADTDSLVSESLKEEICRTLEIKDPLEDEITDAATNEIKEYLKRLEVIFIIPKTDEEKVIFSQPGLRYSQVKKEMMLLKESPVLEELRPSEREAFADRLDNLVKGVMMEDIIFVDLARNKELQKDKTYAIGTYRQQAGAHEIDITVTNVKTDEIILLEVKHSSAYVPEYQAKHLCDEEFCQEIEAKRRVKVTGKAVIYQGENCYYDVAGVSYWHVNTFMDNPLACLQKTRQRYLKYLEVTSPVSGTKRWLPSQEKATEENMVLDHQPSEESLGKTIDSEDLVKEGLTQLTQSLKKQGVSLDEIGQTLQSIVKKEIKACLESKER